MATEEMGTQISVRPFIVRPSWKKIGVQVAKDLQTSVTVWNKQKALYRKVGRTGNGITCLSSGVSGLVAVPVQKIASGKSNKVPDRRVGSKREMDS